MKNVTDYFDDDKLQTLAFTHKSWVNENMSVSESNERMEFLGDAILEFIVSKELYKLFPKEEEGYLTALRANLVNTINLAQVARSLNLGEKLLLSIGEQAGGGRENQSLLANTVEAVIGGIYLNKGIQAAEEFIQTHLLSNLDEKLKEPLKDAKTRLQEHIQSLGTPAPKYRVVNESGPDHDKIFIIEVIIDGESLAQGTGKNKAIAEQEAANVALNKIGLD